MLMAEILRLAVQTVEGEAPAMVEPELDKSVPQGPEAAEAAEPEVLLMESEAAAAVEAAAEPADVM